MGQKVNPNGFRYGITKLHKVNWFAEKEKFIEFLLEDQKIYEYIEKFTREYSIGKIEISRNQKNDVLVKIYSSKPGIILGENSKNLISFKKDIQKFTRNKKLNLNINVITIEKPELNARLVAENIAIKLENRGSFRAAQKQAIRFAFKNGAKGIKTSVSGRLNGVDMARTEGYTEGEMKLHTLRQDIDYAKTTAKTTYGALGIKVWISKGEKIEKSKK